MLGMGGKVRREDNAFLSVLLFCWGGWVRGFFVIIILRDSRQVKRKKDNN